MSIIEKAAKRLANSRSKGKDREPHSPAAADSDADGIAASAAIDDGVNPFSMEDATAGPGPAEYEATGQSGDIGEGDGASEPAAGFPPTGQSPTEAEAAQEVGIEQFEQLPSQPPVEEASPFQADVRPEGGDSTALDDAETADGGSDVPKRFNTVVAADDPNDLDSPFSDLQSPSGERKEQSEYRSSIAAAYSSDDEASPFTDEASGSGREEVDPLLDVLGDGSLSGEEDEWHFDDIEDGEENILPLTKLNPGLLLSPEGGRTRTAEEFRVIKRPLLVKAFDRRSEGHQHSNLIMVTSAVQSEGKTFISLNLAISIAMEMDSTVLLVDADVAKPGLSRILQVPERPGLIEQLTDEHDELADLLIRTDIPKLTVLPAGERHKRSTELLASIRMRALLDEMASRYSDRIVLFDSPPLLESTEAFVLASQMGQVVMVVESESTSQMVVKEALSQFEDLGNVSLVLNKCKENIFTNLLSGKYSGYGYGYGYGAEADSG